MSKIIDKIKNLPQAPGVYFFYAADKQLLYIGKATNLRSRVSSYFRGIVTESNSENRSSTPFSVAGRSEWIGSMVSQVVDIQFEQSDSVLEALILESNLIKAHQPKYNTLEKDDKSFSYFAITKEEFPRVLILRKTDLRKYVIQSEAKNPVINKASDIDTGILHYVQDDEKIKTKKLMKLTKLQASFGPYTSKQQMQIALKIIRRIFPFHALKQQSEKGCLDFQLGNCPGPYAGAITKDDYKKNIRGIRMILEGKKKSLLRMMEKEMQNFAKKHEFEKAGNIRNKIFALNHIRDVALMTRDFENEESRIMNHESSEIQITNDKFQTNSEIQNSKLEIDSKFKIQNSKFFRIEAYDISNISGDHAVGSMVVFENGVANKSQYRKFKIKTVAGANDVGMMKEVLLRRFKNDWPMPDLVLLDGGQGHANMMSELVKELGLDILVVAVAKGKTRKNLNFQFPTLPTGRQVSNKFSMSEFPKELQEFLNDKNSVKAIMDEAHRFAITYHRKVRSKNSLT